MDRLGGSSRLFRWGLRFSEVTPSDTKWHNHLEINSQVNLLHKNSKTPDFGSF
jgi:hypothetical protein